MQHVLHALSQAGVDLGECSALPRYEVQPAGATSNKMRHSKQMYHADRIVRRVHQTRLS